MYVFRAWFAFNGKTVRAPEFGSPRRARNPVERHFYLHDVYGDKWRIQFFRELRIRWKVLNDRSPRNNFTKRTIRGTRPRCCRTLDRPFEFHTGNTNIYIYITVYVFKRYVGTRVMAFDRGQNVFEPKYRATRSSYKRAPRRVHAGGVLATKKFGKNVIGYFVAGLHLQCNAITVHEKRSIIIRVSVCLCVIRLSVWRVYCKRNTYL